MIALTLLTTGEHVLGKVSQVENSFIVDKPRVIVPVAKGQVALVDYFPKFVKAAEDDRLVLNLNHVVWYSEVVDEVASAYTEHISGLILPSTGLKV